MPRIKFGTDGWRAIISDEFTFKNVEIAAQAISDFIKLEKGAIYKKKEIAVGYDTRFLSDKYAEIVSCVLAANGIKVILSNKPCPTPAICVSIKDGKLSGGVMITASHNPPQYNGIKYKGYFGGSAGSDIIQKIEKRLYKTPVKTMAFKKACEKNIIKKEDMVDLQLGHVKAYINMNRFKGANLKVLVDSMNGTGGYYFRDILEETGVKIDFMNADFNPSFGGRAPEPNEKHLKTLMDGVKNGGYDLGVATDGDADRVGIVDEKGDILTGHKVMALLLLHLKKNRNMTGGVVQTICGTNLVNKMCKKFNLKMYETPVGFKYIAGIMTKEDILIGGEETGGIGFKNYIPERDGFLSALLIMELILTEKKALSEIVSDLTREYGSFVYEREDLVFDESKRKKLMDGIRKKPLESILGKKVSSIDNSDGSKFICVDSSWLLFRLSGTEPKLRIYSETSSKEESLKYLEFGKKYAFSLM